MSDEAAKPSTEGNVIFSYKGRAYNRPCGRGICLGESMIPLTEKLPEGNFEIEIIVRAVPNGGESRDAS